MKARIDATFERGKALAKNADFETQADFARYLCILVSGYLEKSVAELVLEHSRKHGGPTLQRYVERTTHRFTNANCQKIKELLGGFNPDWKVKLDQVLVDEYKDAVDGLVALRNEIAHGGPGGITTRRVTDYYLRIQKVVDEIADLCAPT